MATTHSLFISNFLILFPIFLNQKLLEKGIQAIVVYIGAVQPGGGGGGGGGEGGGLWTSMY